MSLVTLCDALRTIFFCLVCWFLEKKKALGLDFVLGESQRFITYLVLHQLAMVILSSKLAYRDDEVTKNWTKSHACKGIMILMIARNSMLANHVNIVKIQIIFYAM